MSPLARLTSKVLIGAIGLVASAASWAQEEEGLNLASRAWVESSDVAECGDCHYAGTSSNPLRVKPRFPRMNELAIWLANDRHALARLAIEPFSDAAADAAEKAEGLRASQARSRQICENLGWDAATDAGYTNFREQCLTCHAGYATGGTQEGFSRTGAQVPGLSCIYCHQVADDRRWISLHANRSIWSTQSHAEKSSSGLRDLTSIAARTALCADCHLGNIPNHQFVTHAMYVAGHPPLPAFELSAFSEAMPRHWMSPAETVTAALEAPSGSSYLTAQFPELVGSSSSPESLRCVAWETRGILVSSLRLQMHALDLLSDSEPANLWGDYALYDCSACHHALHTPSDRQVQGFPGIPGRPRMPAWNSSLVRAALLQSTRDLEKGTDSGMVQPARFDANTRVQDLLDAHPFGVREQVAAVVGEARGVLEAAVVRLQAQPLGDSAAQEVLRNLARTPESMLTDYASAQQVGWALQTISRDLEQSPTLPSSHVDSLTRLQDVLRCDPSGSTRMKDANMSKHALPGVSEDLRRRATFKPADFLQALRQLSEK